MAERNSAERNPTREITEMIKDEPWKAVAIAAGLGFFTGGGLRSRTAGAILLLVSRIATRAMVSNYVMGALTNGGGRRDFTNRK
jgi:hypothetical protein